MSAMNYPRHRSFAVLALALLLTPFALTAQTTAPKAGAPADKTERYIAIDNVCAWPNLTVLPDGTIVATIFGQPTHGQTKGAAECWASKDGRFWEKRGIPAPNAPSTNRMNVAAGLAKNGDLLVACSGWSNLQQPGQAKEAAFRDAILRAWVCRSSDGGRTWIQYKNALPAPQEGFSEYVPFGDIFVGEDGALHTVFYARQFAEPGKSTKRIGHRSWHFRSDDDGRTWQRISVIGPKSDETDLFHLGGKRWLAAARSDAVYLYRSDDDGKTWQEPQRVTEPQEVNAHLARLKDGRLLLSYGNRVKADQYGVWTKLSSDEGKTWNAPVHILHSAARDCGYPSSIQRPDGAVVTAYYSASVANHTRYHMGVVIWTAPAPNP